MDTPEILTVKEVAGRLRCSVGTVRSLFHRGELAGFRIGYDIRIHETAIGEYIERHKNKRPEPKPTPTVNFRTRKIHPAMSGFKYL